MALGRLQLVMLLAGCCCCVQRGLEWKLNSHCTPLTGRWSVPQTQLDYKQDNVRCAVFLCVCLLPLLLVVERRRNCADE